MTKIILKLRGKCLLALSFFSIVCLFSCSKNIQLFLQSFTNSNEGQSVVVRIYLLKSEINFQRMTFDSFWKGNNQVLAGDMVGEEIEIILHPEEKINLDKIKILKDAKFLAVAGNFYQPDINQWKYLFDLSQMKGDHLTIGVGKNKLIITNPKD